MFCAAECINNNAKLICTLFHWIQNELHSFVFGSFAVQMMLKLHQAPLSAYLWESCWDTLCTLRASDSLLAWMCCSQKETPLNALAPRQAWKAFYWRNSIFWYKLEKIESDIYKTLNQICSFCFSSATNAQNIWEKRQMLMFLLFVEWAHWPKVQKTINSNTLAKIVAESEIFASSIFDKHQLLLPACCGMPTAHCIVNGQNWPQYFLDNPGGRWCTHHPHLLIQLLVWCWQAGPWCHTSSCGWRRVPRHDNSDVSNSKQVFK